MKRKKTWSSPLKMHSRIPCSTFRKGSNHSPKARTEVPLSPLPTEKRFMMKLNLHLVMRIRLKYPPHPPMHRTTRQIRSSTSRSCMILPILAVSCPRIVSMDWTFGHLPLTSPRTRRYHHQRWALIRLIQFNSKSKRKSGSCFTTRISKISKIN